MAKPDPLQLANGHLCVAGRAALDFHRALVLAYQTSELGSRRRISLGLVLRSYYEDLHYLANEIDELPEFFRGNLPASLRAAARAWQSPTT